ncbi:phospholipase A2 inhibitor alpha-like protein [Ahaetulla prasina]|uniref:phospholipase A2 inhibitor alpha-like protein n=1 Tax=Ahaetulla prasina TaxID=499056 RepID=UPI002647BAD9|nr:phospholipase A2 inhibitor alpha-like protein [Ahaetulla prasina]
MRLILLSSLLLLGLSLANGHDTDPEGKLLNSLVKAVERFDEKLNKWTNAFLTVHRARSFGSGSERLYVTNKQVGNFEDLGNICVQAGGRIPSPQLPNENKAFASVLERHNKEAYLVVHNSATFTNWAAGEPNNEDGNKPCVKADAQGAWRSVSCDEELLVVCEFSFI